MATVPSSSPPLSPTSATNSQHSATYPFPPSPPKPKVEGPTCNGGVPNVVEKKPDIIHIPENLDNPDYIEKYKRYEADFSRRLMAKYFSNRSLYGGFIFDEKMAIDDEIIRSSRWHPTRSYADPVQGFEDLSSSSSTSTEETPTNIANGKHQLKTNG